MSNNRGKALDHRLDQRNRRSGGLRFARFHDADGVAREPESCSAAARHYSSQAPRGPCYDYAPIPTPGTAPRAHCVCEVPGACGSGHRNRDASAGRKRKGSAGTNQPCGHDRPGRRLGADGATSSRHSSDHSGWCRLGLTWQPGESSGRRSGAWFPQAPCHDYAGGCPNAVGVSLPKLQRDGGYTARPTKNSDDPHDDHQAALASANRSGRSRSLVTAPAVARSIATAISAVTRPRRLAAQMAFCEKPDALPSFSSEPASAMAASIRRVASLAVRASTISPR